MCNELRTYNCKVLSRDHLHVSWSIKGGVIDVRLSGKISPNSFMAFGVSGSASSPRGADVAVAWVNPRDGTATVVDYHLQSLSQVRARFGSALRRIWRIWLKQKHHVVGQREAVAASLLPETA